MGFSSIPRAGVVHRALVWVVAKDRITGAPAPFGIWSGGTDASFEIDGAVRDYVAARSLLVVDDMVASVGLRAQSQTIRLAAASPQLVDAVRGYDLARAPVEVHAARFDPETDALLGIDEFYVGYIEKMPETRPAKNAAGADMVATLVSEARPLSIGKQLFMSDANQRLRGSDPSFKYAQRAANYLQQWGAGS